MLEKRLVAKFKFLPGDELLKVGDTVKGMHVDNEYVQYVVITSILSVEWVGFGVLMEFEVVPATKKQEIIFKKKLIRKVDVT